jgi:hypothetical protein
MLAFIREEESEQPWYIRKAKTTSSDDYNVHCYDLYVGDGGLAHFIHSILQL